MIVVALDGSGNFKSVQEAVDSISDDSIKTAIYIKKGIYKEKLFIEKRNIVLKGECEESTVITYDDYAYKLLPNGEKMGTFNSFSVFIGGDDFYAENITFENSSGCGSKVGQAVAVYLDADRAVFKKCKFLGHQDTIFTGPLPPNPIIPGSFKGPRENAPRKFSRHYFEACYIEGDVDFIFGGSIAYFYGCEIFSKNRNESINGYITAASTPDNQSYGYIFEHCKLTSDAVAKTVYLGRPWRNFAKVAFIKCELGEHITLEGWDNWGKKDSEKTTEFVEYENIGKGSNKTDRVSWSKQPTDIEVKKYDRNIIFLVDNENWMPWELEL